MTALFPSSSLRPLTISELTCGVKALLETGEMPTTKGQPRGGAA